MGMIIATFAASMQWQLNSRYEWRKIDFELKLRSLFVPNAVSMIQVLVSLKCLVSFLIPQKALNTSMTTSQTWCDHKLFFQLILNCIFVTWFMNCIFVTWLMFYGGFNRLPQATI